MGAEVPNWRATACAAAFRRLAWPAIINGVQTVVTAERLWDGTRQLDRPIVVIEDGLIASISTRAAGEAPGKAGVLDFPGATLAPGFFDVHFHGAKGHDVMEATPAAIASIGGFLASHGTGSYLATTVTAPLDATLQSLEALAEARQVASS